MSATVATELQEFVQFAQAKLAAGETKLSPEEALELWRIEHPSEEFEEEVRAIQEAINDMEAGDRGVPLEQVEQQFREMQRLRIQQP